MPPRGHAYSYMYGGLFVPHGCLSVFDNVAVRLVCTLNAWPAHSHIHVHNPTLAVTTSTPPIGHGFARAIRRKEYIYVYKYDFRTEMILIPSEPIAICGEIRIKSGALFFPGVALDIETSGR